MSSVVAPAPTKTTKAEAPAPAPAPVEAPARPALKEGEAVLMTSLVGRLIHPYQVPLEFNPEVATRVKVDGWVITQYEAGKLGLATP